MCTVNHWGTTMMVLTQTDASLSWDEAFGREIRLEQSYFGRQRAAITGF